MQQQKFTIRIKPYDGESLSSFLLRCVGRNKVNFRSVLTQINRDVYEKMSKKYIDRLDRLPSRVIDIEKLTTLLGIPVEILESLSFSSIYQYFLDTKDFDKSFRSVGLEHLLEKNHRRFCPQCIKETGYYKLIWQVEDIHTCNVHHVPLTSSCQKCNQKQPYVWDQMNSLHCCYCNSSLSKNEDKQENSFKSEKRKYDNWSYLSDAKNLTLHTMSELTTQQTLAVLFLYTLGEGSNVFDRQLAIKTVSKNLIGGLLRMIKDKERPIYVTLPRLFELLSTKNISIREFMNQKPSREFIDSLFNSKKETELGPCLAPWCSSYKTNSSMKKVKKPYYFNDRKKYTKASVCTDCYMEYGFSKEDGNWSSVNNTINLVGKYTDLFMKGLTRREICSQLGIHPVKYYDLLGYINYHQILPSDKCWEPMYIPKDLCNYFIKLIKIGGRLSIQAKTLYDWSLKEYFYYLHSKEVQKYLYFMSFSDRTIEHKPKAKDFWKQKVINEIHNFKNRDQEITVSSIAQSLMCSTETLSGYGLTDIIHFAKDEQKKEWLSMKKEIIKNKVDEFIEYKQKSDSPLLSKEIYIHIQRSHSYIKKQHPELHSYIFEKVESDKTKIREVKIEKYKKMVLETVIYLREQELNINAKSIVQILGIPYVTLQKSYPEVLDFIKEFKTGEPLLSVSH